MNRPAPTLRLWIMMALGLGDLAAKWFFIPLQGSLTRDGITDYHRIFLWPAGLALAAAAVLCLAFWPPASLATSSGMEDDLETEPPLVS